MRSPSARARAPRRAAATGRLSRALVAWAVLAGTAFHAAPARAQSQADASANDVADKVMDPDRLYSNFLVAEKRLAAALKKCGKNACSKSVRARLLRDLGVVYIVGLRRLDKGKEYLTKAVKADPSIELDQRIATPELEQLFADAGGGSGSGSSARAAEPEPAREEPAREPEPEAAPEPEPEPERAEPEPTEPESGGSSDEPSAVSSEPGDDATATEEPEKTADDVQLEPKVKRRNAYVSLTLQQDFLYYPGESGVCDDGVDTYDCFDYRGTEYFGPIYEEEGNSVEGGLSRATTRLLIGYDRRMSNNVLLGARLGYAFGGGPTPLEGSAFFPFHIELRAALFLGSRPFARKGLRPNLSVAAGVAELTSHRTVEYWDGEQSFEDEAEAGKLDAWRRTGKVFLAPGFGVVVPAGSRGGVTIDLRGMFHFGKSATGLALAVGYALGI